jgi:hypothetical protein
LIFILNEIIPNNIVVLYSSASEYHSFNLFSHKFFKFAIFL